MSNKSAGKPSQKRKSKEEIMYDLKRSREIARKREIVVDHLYPSLVEATVSVDEAKFLVQAINTSLMEQVLGWMKEKNFKDLMEPIIKQLCPEGEREAEITKMFSALENENVFTAKELISGMSNVLEQMSLEILRDKKLSELTPDWNKMLY
jgi:hypothetical protein